MQYENSFILNELSHNNDFSNQTTIDDLFHLVRMNYFDHIPNPMEINALEMKKNGSLNMTLLYL